MALYIMLLGMEKHQCLRRHHSKRLTLEIEEPSKMFKIAGIILAFAMMVHTAEISSFSSSIDNRSELKPEHETHSLENHAIPEVKSDVKHPVYGEHNQGRFRIAPVRPHDPVNKHDAMLADQPDVPTDVNRIDDLGIFGNGYIPATAEVRYPDVPFPQTYYYDPMNNYDLYDPKEYMIESYPSTLGFLWSQFNGRTLVTYVGHTIMWIFNSIFVLFLGSLVTVGVCSYTNLCTIAFNRGEPIQEEMRAVLDTDTLEKIRNYADFVRNAIDKYQTMQKSTEMSPALRKRRGIYFNDKNKQTYC